MLSASTGTPRICAPTLRGVIRTPARSGLYEAEDVLDEVDSVERVSLVPTKWFTYGDRIVSSLAWRSPWKGICELNPGIRPVQLRNDYDMFVAICQNVWDLILFNAVKGRRERCRTSVCWLDEVWGRDARAIRSVLPLLKTFDHVVLNLSGSVHAVSDMLERDCHFVSAGVDVDRFSPHPESPTRPIDVYSVGRRDEAVHQGMLGMAKANRLFYVYDTFGGNSGSIEVPDHRQHRDMFAAMAKRSRYFLVDVAKVGRDRETGGQSEPGRRYFEGAAAGCVMIGQVPSSPVMSALFPWEDAVVSLQVSDLVARLSDLESDTKRQSQIGRRNASEAALRHDWSYRWKEIMSIAGLTPMPAMAERERRLKNLAAMAWEER